MSSAEMELWALAVALSALVLGIVLWPLIKRRNASDAPREVYDINVYKDQLLEIEADLERGLLSEDQAEAARNEIKRRMLAAADSAEAKSDPVEAASGKSNVFVITAIALFVPIGAVLLYLDLGQPGEPDQPLAERKVNAHAAQSEQDKEMLQAVAKLAKHLESNPDDVRGWSLLARTYITQGRYDDAVNAYAGAYKASQEDADIAVDYAEAMTLAADSQVPPSAQVLFKKVLETDSLSPKARYYLGLYAAQQGDLRGAMQEWIDLAAMSPPDAPWMQILDQQMQRAAEESGIDPTTLEPSPQAKVLAEKVREAMKRAQAEQDAAPSPTTDDVKAAMGMSEGDREEMIRSMVQRLADRMKDDPTNKEGWLRLEQAYRVLGEDVLADEAAEKAAALP